MLRDSIETSGVLAGSLVGEISDLSTEVASPPIKIGAAWFSQIHETFAIVCQFLVYGLSEEGVFTTFLQPILEPRKKETDERANYETEQADQPLALEQPSKEIKNQLKLGWHRGRLSHRVPTERNASRVVMRSVSWHHRHQDFILFAATLLSARKIIEALDSPKPNPCKDFFINSGTQGHQTGTKSSAAMLKC